MLALIIDILGSYFLAKKIARWFQLILLAVLLGIVSSFSTNLSMHYIWPEIFPPGEAVMRAVTGSVLHPIICVFFVWWFHSKKLKAQASNISSS